MMRSILGALSLAFLCASCSSDRIAAGGPITMGNEPGEICVPQTKAGEYGIGFDVLTNTGQKPVQISSVVLSDPHNVELLESFLSPLPGGGGGDTLGVWHEWPIPTASFSAQLARDWQARVPAMGTDRLDPTAGASQETLTLHLHSTGPAGSYRQVEVNYTFAGKRYTAHNVTSVVIKQKC